MNNLNKIVKKQEHIITLQNIIIRNQKYLLSNPNNSRKYQTSLVIIGRLSDEISKLLDEINPY